MKSDHRHELKANELADWLAHFPDWLKANRTTLIAAGAVIVVAAVVYFWMFYQNNIASAREQVRLTNLVTQLPRQKAELARAQGGDQSYLLLNLAKDLQTFAEGSGNRAMAALALIERGDTLRAELHYRKGEVSREEIAKQIALAQASYEQALAKAPATQSALAATARFGIGLCEEELGNLGKAREIYQDVAENKTYAGTAARAAATLRLKTMDDYKGIVVFKPAPEPPAQASMPTFQLTPGDANSPVMIPMPNDAPMGPVPVAPDTVPVPSDVPAPGDADSPAVIPIPNEAPAGPVPVVPEAAPAPSSEAPAAVEVPVNGPDANAPAGG
jgi:flagellar basal body-associated protein FliL